MGVRAVRSRGPGDSTPLFVLAHLVAGAVALHALAAVFLGVVFLLAAWLE